MTDTLPRRQLVGFTTREAKLLRQVMAELVAALPKCSKCGAVATHERWRKHSRQVCDVHAPKSDRRRAMPLKWGRAAKRASEVEEILERSGV
jgi:hypothetical protein